MKLKLLHSRHQEYATFWIFGYLPTEKVSQLANYRGQANTRKKDIQTKYRPLRTNIFKISAWPHTRRQAETTARYDTPDIKMTRF
jgi:hypothetical protein